MAGPLRQDGGFTLTELLVVIVVIGILAMLAIPQFAFYKVHSYNANAVSDLKMLKVSLESYFIENKAYP